MSASSPHLTEWTLEQLAEESLAEPERARAMEHASACGRCMSELDAYRALVVALAGLQRFAPAPDFGDAVMARVRVGPRRSAALVRVRRWLPKTRRGWMGLATALVAPALPFLGLAVWLLTHPLVTPGMLWQWGSLQAQEGARTSAGYLVAWTSATGWFDRIQEAYAALTAVPLTTVGVVLAGLAIVIPLSAWSLLRLTRTPMGTVTYAN